METTIAFFGKKMCLRNDCKSWNNVEGDHCKKLLEERLPSCSHVHICGVGGEDKIYGCFGFTEALAFPSLASVPETLVPLTDCHNKCVAFFGCSPTTVFEFCLIVLGICQFCDQ